MAYGPDATVPGKDAQRQLKADGYKVVTELTLQTKIKDFRQLP